MFASSLRLSFVLVSLVGLHVPIANAAISKDTVTALLKRPSFRERVQLLKSEGPDGLKALRSVAFDAKTSDRMKWNAIVSLGVVYGKSAMPDLERALKSDEWILRNSALVALRSFDSELSRTWSLKLLNDRALVVRSSSVDSLAKSLDDETVRSLWDALNDPKNFRGSRSLWIRRQIVNVIASQPRETDASRFIEVLKGGDQDLHGPAIGALEQITGLRKGSDSHSVRERSKLWVQWWETKKI